MIKLREFSQEFASREFVEGGDFFGFRDEQQHEDDSEGTNNDDGGTEEEQIDADTGVDNIDLDIDIDADTVQDSQVSQNNDIEANSTRTRMLRYTPFNPTNDIISSNKASKSVNLDVKPLVKGAFCCLKKKNVPS